MMDATAEDRNYCVAAVEKALRVLDVFSSPPHRFGLTEVSARTGLSTNQAFRLLYTLVACGYARQEPDTKLYSLGPRLFGLVSALFHGDELLLAARDTLQWAHAETQETVALIVPDGEESTTCVDVRESEHPLLVAASVGSRFSHLHAGAAGKVLLAARDDTAVERYLASHQPLERCTVHTPATAEAVWDEIRTVRSQGYAVSDQEVAEGMYGIAAPIRGHRSEVVAVITLSAPVTRASPAERARHRAIIVEAGRRISVNLGFRVADAVPA